MTAGFPQRGRRTPGRGGRRRRTRVLGGQPARVSVRDRRPRTRVWPLGAVRRVRALGCCVRPVARLASLLGLGFTFAVILGFVIPAILDGKPPLTVAIVGCAAIVLVVLYLTHGLGQATTIAVAGTIASLVLTGVLSVVAVRALDLSGAGDESSFLLGQSHGVDLRGLLLAGILIGSLGVLDDVTVTQAATVQELALANPDLSATTLRRSGPGRQGTHRLRHQHHRPRVCGGLAAADSAHRLP